MPVGGYTKEEIRRIAGEIGLDVASKPDSQDICFIPDGDYQKFLEAYTGKKLPEGNFVDQNGNILGRHKGITSYTIGQRKGLNLALGRPVFVTDIRTETNEVVIGNNEDVFGSCLIAGDLNWMAIDRPDQPLHLFAKIRYAHKGEGCTVAVTQNETGQDLARVTFDQPVRAITSGQAIVFYDGDIVVGGGRIIRKL